MKILLAALSLLFILSACADRNTQENVAEDFVYNYYLHANQEMALRLADGLAKKKLEEEIELVRAVREGSEPSNVHSQIQYKKVGTKVEDENRVFFRYQLTIKDTSISNVIRNTVIFTESLDGQWRVVNFDEYGE